MEFDELIRRRVSVRSYDPGRPVAEDVMKRILESGRLALSAANRQPWKFLVISSPEMLSRIKASYNKDWYRDAPHILVMLGFREKAWKRSYDGYNSIETDLAIAMTHIILSAENEGVGACWIAAFDPAILNKAIGLSDDQVIFGITPLGYPGKDYIKNPQKIRKDFEDVVEFI
jgi:nitroreductase